MISDLHIVPALALLTAPVLAQDVISYGGDTSKPAPLPPKPALTVVEATHQPRMLTIKFAHGSDVRLGGDWFVGSDPEVGAVNGVLAAAGATPRRMFDQSEAWLTAWRQSGEARSGIVLHDLNLFYFVDAPADDVTGALCDALNELELVSLAWPTVTGGDPTVPACATVSVGSTFSVGSTPDFTEGQHYRRPAPWGVDAFYGNTFSGGLGAGTTIVDCETGWTDDHEDIINKAEDQFVGWIPANYPWDHGTAVVGEMIGEDNGFGVVGICPGSDIKMSTHTPQGMPQNIPGGVANGAEAAGPGDMLVIEIQCFGGAPAPFPCEFDPAIFATIQTATANGTHVFAAAGNGSNDLDQSAYGGAFDLSVKDSGSVIVGASDGAPLDTASFSNFGSRISSHGWGNDVVTLAYGDLQSGPATQEYTDTFSGTSSATPIVTGAGVIVNTVHRAAFGSDLTPIALRDLLGNTGTVGGVGGDIGTRPDVRRALRALDVPEVDVAGDLTVGGSADVTSFGQAGNVYGLFWSDTLAATPTNFAPLGEYFLDVVTSVPLAVSGTIGAGGSTTDNIPIPNSPAFAGLVSHVQGWQAFTTQPGGGSFSNFFTFTIN